jgi:5'-3' exonuclease
MLSVDQILNAPLATETVNIPKLKGDITIRELTGTERAAIELLSMDVKNNKELHKKIKPMVAAYSIVDENGDRMFTDKQIPDLAKLSGTVLDKIAGVAERLAGMGPEDIPKAAKKSMKTQDGEATG